MNKTSYTLSSITLIESQFKRAPQIDIEDKGFSSKIDINIEHQREGNKIFIILSLSFNAGTSSDSNQISSLVKMLGAFEFNHINDDLPLDKFINLNGPAIIFPFIREHLASISMKAGINPILLQPVNFVKLAEERKKKEEAGKINNKS